MSGKGYINTKKSHMAFIDATFTFTYHTKQLNAWPKRISQSCSELQLAVCLSRECGAI